MTMPLNGTMRWLGAASGVGGAAFWIYTFYYISRLPQGDGTGFQWLAEVPLTGIFLCFCLPAMGLAAANRAPVAAALLGFAGLLAYASVWQDLLREFAG